MFERRAPGAPWPLVEVAGARPGGPVDDVFEQIVAGLRPRDALLFRCPTAEPARHPAGRRAEKPAPPSAPTVAEALAGAWEDRHPVAALLAGTRPGQDLIGLLAYLPPADADDAALLEAAAGWERVMSWAASRQAQVVSELWRRRTAERRSEFLGDELAARLVTTRSSGDAKVGLALGLDRFPVVADALDRGEIDTRKAAVLTEQVLGLPEGTAEELVDAGVRRAPTLTLAQLRAELRRLELSADPDGARARHQRAKAERHVTLTPAEDSMAWLSAYLPADDAVAVLTTLTSLADLAPADDTRSVGARRADALVDLATRYLDAGVCPDGPLPTRQRRRPHLLVTAAATTILGLDQAPAHLEGYGPIPPDMARKIAAEATWQPLLLEARTGELVARSSSTYRPSATLAQHVIARDRTCTFPGCRIAAVRCDIDHIEPFEHDRPPDEQTTEPNLQALCRHHHRAKTHGRWRPSRDPETGTTTWRAPTGHLHVRGPVPLGPPPHPDPSTTDPRDTALDPGPPPF